MSGHGSHQVYDLTARLGAATARAENAELALKKWTDVFGHLDMTPDAIGNMWHAQLAQAETEFDAAAGRAGIRAGGLLRDRQELANILRALDAQGLLNVRASDTRADADARVAARDALQKFNPVT